MGGSNSQALQDYRKYQQEMAPGAGWKPMSPEEEQSYKKFNIKENGFLPSTLL